MKYTKMISSVLLAVAGIFLIAGTANAAGAFRSGDNVNVTKNEKIDSTLFVAGNNVTVAGEVNGDVFCAGQNISVTGTVNGDVICAGQNVRISGTVTGDVRLAGQTVNLEATVRGNATVFASTFTSDSRSAVAGDLTLTGEGSTLNGSVGRDLTINGQNVTIDGAIGRDINGNTQNLVLGQNAAVAGNIAYTGEQDIKKTEGATIGGEVVRSEPTHDQRDSDGWLSFAPLTGGMWLYGLVSLLLVSLAVILIAPKQVQAVSEYVVTRPGRTLLVGVVASVVVPIIMVALLVTLVGIPLALLVLLCWLLIQFLAGPVIGYAIGRLVLRGNDKPVLVMLFGSLAILVLYLIPIVGFITLIAVMWFGIGALLSHIYDGHRAKSAKKKVRA